MSDRHVHIVCVEEGKLDEAEEHLRKMGLGITVLRNLDIINVKTADLKIIAEIGRLSFVTSVEKSEKVWPTDDGA